MRARAAKSGVRYERRRQGQPALVFVHDIFCSRALWRHQVERFEREHLVVALDQRGHGESVAFEDGFDIPTLGADLAGLVEELGAASVALVGHGLGARVVLEAAMRLGEAPGALATAAERRREIPQRSSPGPGRRSRGAGSGASRTH